MQEEAYVKTHLVNGIATIEFFHPKGNSLPSAVLGKLAHEIDSYGSNDLIKVIILRSAGTKSFCGGASFDELSSIETEEQGAKFFSGFGSVINAMRKATKFIIVRVQGRAVGGGVGLIAAADYAIANQEAEIKLSELSIGIGPFVIGPAVERKIGLAAFSSLAIDATMWRNAEWAKRKGLYSEVHPSTEDMDEAVNRLADSLIHSNPGAIRAMKRIFWEGTSHWEDLLPERAAISGRLLVAGKKKSE